MKVCIIGLGYVGLPLAVRAAEVGHSVIGIDLDKRKIDALRAGTSYIEDVTDARLRAAGVGTRLMFCPELILSHGSFDICIVTVPTPLRHGDPDLSYVISAAESIGRSMRPHLISEGCAIVLESTTYPGTTEGIFRETIEEHSGLVAGKDFLLGFSPERIDPGVSVHTLENTPKLVSATTDEGLAKIKSFYDTIVDVTVPVSSPRVAELTKCFENIQAYVGIGLINEVAEICHDLDIDVHEMVAASMTKGHSMIEWFPGPGVGGHCLPIDGTYVSWLTREKLGRPFKFVELATDVNEGRPRYVVDRAVAMLAQRGILPRESRVLVMGLAYKPSVGDLRESPALPIVEDLVGRGVHVTVIDPLVEGWDSTPVLTIEDLPGALQHFDLVVNVTNHDVFDYDKVAREAQQVLDCRNSMRPSDTVVAL